MNQRKRIIAGNWKMNKTREEATELSSALVSALSGQEDLPEIVLCPPFTSLQTVVEKTSLSPVAVGAQNMDWRDSGAFTGEISPVMLLDLGVKYVIIGHSERRQFFGETNTTVNQKLKAAIKHSLVPIVCLGETLDERENNLTDAVVSRQIAAALADIDATLLAELIIAYEPVWAIGTGKVCDAKEANRVASVIRKTVSNLYTGVDIGLSVPILYGGSVNPKNVDEQLAQPDIDGSLVGGASLKPEEFLPIIQAAQNRARLAASGT